MSTITYRPFLTQVIQKLFAYHSNKWDAFVVVLPNQLSIDYFHQLLIEMAGASCRLPTCVTLHHFMLMNSQMEPADPLWLVRELHGLVNEICHKEMPFEQFYAWGKTLLADFNCVDKYLVNGSELFVALMQQKQLMVPITASHAVGKYVLKSAQEKDIHLSLFQDKKNLFLWKKLPLIYQSFRERLVQQGKGYEGLCDRIALDRFCYGSILGEQHVIFAGFNQLTPVQEQFMVRYQSIAPVSFFWDVDVHYVENENNLAGYYLRQNRKKSHFQKSFPVIQDSYFNDIHKKVVITEMHTMMEQIQSIVDLLQSNAQKDAQFVFAQAAIVVSGTDCLVPLLDRLASLSIPFHGRFAYPLCATVIYSLVEKLIDLWAKCRSMEMQQDLYSGLASSFILLRPLVGAGMQASIDLGLAWLAKCMVNLSELKYQLGPFYVWLNIENKDLLNYLYDIFCFMDQHFVHNQSLQLAINRAALNYILQYIDIVRTIHFTAQADIGTFVLNVFKTTTIPIYQNNPFQGVYIIDVLESQNLDFEYLFFLNMSDDRFPQLRHIDSCLTYNVRNDFGLPLMKEIECNIAYGFYRLLQRAQSIHCSYTKQSQGGVVSEMSRLLLQLSFDSQLQIVHQSLPVILPVCTIPVISIEKDHAVMQLLDQFLIDGEQKVDRSFTPSALITYLSCPLQFYFAYLVRLKADVPQDGAESMQLGILFHQVYGKIVSTFGR